MMIDDWQLSSNSASCDCGCTVQATGTIILITGLAIALLFFEYEVALPTVGLTAHSVQLRKTPSFCSEVTLLDVQLYKTPAFVEVALPGDCIRVISERSHSFQLPINEAHFITGFHRADPSVRTWLTDIHLILRFMG